MTVSVRALIKFKPFSIMSADHRIGPEVVAEAVRVLETIVNHSDLKLDLKSYDFGGAAIDNHGVPLPDETLNACKEADAVLMGTCSFIIQSGSIAKQCEKAPSVVLSGVWVLSVPNRVSSSSERSSAFMPTSVPPTLLLRACSNNLP